MAAQKSQRNQKDKPKFTTLLSTPIALNDNTMLQVRSSTYEGKERSGEFVALRKGFVGKDIPLESVSCGDNPDVLDAVGDAFKAHAKAMRDRRASR